MTKTFWVAGVPALALLGLCIWLTAKASERVEETPLRESVERLARMEDISVEKRVVEPVREMLVLGSLRPAKHPEWKTAKAVVAASVKPETFEKASKESRILLFLELGAGLAGLVAAAGVVLVIRDLLRLKRVDEDVAGDLMLDRRIAVPAAVSIVVAGLAAAVMAGVLVVFNPSGAVMEGELHGFIGIFLLPVAVWLVSAATLLPRENDILEKLFLPLCALVYIVLIVTWGILAGALHLAWYCSLIVFWVGFSLAVKKMVTSAIDQIIARWQVLPQAGARAAAKEESEDW